MKLAIILLFLLSPLAHTKSNCTAEPLINRQLTIGLIKKYLISHPEIKSVNSFLQCLPEDLRQDVVLVRKSKGASSNCVDDQQPRVILSNKDGSFILAFTGHAERKECNNIEITQFKKSTNYFEYYKIDFPKSDQGESLLVETPPTELPLVSEKNPNTCMGCHSKGEDIDPRPNWESYFLWPGIYGSNDDNPAAYPAEYEQFKKFWNNEKDKNRYKNLIFRESRIDNLFTKTREYDRKDVGKTRPNAAFGFKLNSLNIKRIMRITKASKDFEKFKFAMFALMIFCNRDIKGNIDSNDFFIPKEIEEKYPKVNYMDLQISTSSLIEKYDKDKRDEILSEFKDASEKSRELENKPGYLDRNPELMALRYFLENRGISLAGFSLSNIPKNYAFDDGRYRLLNLPALLYKEIIRDTPELKKYFSENSFQFESEEHQERACGFLRKKSFESFSKK